MGRSTTAGPSTFDAVVVPARAAYLIRPGSRTGMHAAIAEASTRWGGQTEPIIPVTAAGRVAAAWQRVIELAGVDGLVNVDLDPDTARVAAARLHLPLVPLANIEQWGPLQFSTHPAFISPWASDNYVPVAAGTDADLWAVTSAGVVTPEHSAFLAEQTQPIGVPQSEDQVARAQLYGTTLLQRTMSNFAEYRAQHVPSPLPTVLWFCQPNSVRDCLEFWNWRALAPTRFASAPMFLLPVGQTGYWHGFEDAVHGVLRRPSQFSPDVIVNSYSVNDEKLGQEAQRLGLVPAAGKEVTSSHRWPAPPREAPFTYRVDVDLRPWLGFTREYGMENTTEAFTGATMTKVKLNTPFPVRRTGRTYLRISSEAFDGIPRRDSTADLIWRSTTWHGDQLQAATILTQAFNLELQLPTLPEVVQHLLDIRTARHALSDKGRLANPLLEDGTFRILRQPGVLAAALALVTPKSKELHTALGRLRTSVSSEADLLELATTWGGRSERRYRQATELGGRNAAVAAAETLCENGWAQRGLEIRCARCSTRSFIPLVEERSRPTCPGCGYANEYRRQNTQVAVFYRLTTYLDRVAGQGLLPVLWAAAELDSQCAHISLLPGVDVWFPEELDKQETDLFGVLNGQVCAGEVKTSSIGFTRPQVAHDIDVCTRLAVDVYLMVCLEPVAASIEKYAETLCLRAGITHRVMQPPA